jgi:hypothetical protein
VWSTHVSKSTGLLYFYNRLTGAVQVSEPLTSPVRPPPFAHVILVP